MKKNFPLILTLLLFGCATAHQSPLTAEQARKTAVGLANDKAYLVYHTRPFSDDRPIGFEAGRWVWRGFSHDIEATVELATDGSTNNIELHHLVNY